MTNIAHVVTRINNMRYRMNTDLHQGTLGINTRLQQRTLRTFSMILEDFVNREYYDKKKL